MGIVERLILLGLFISGLAAAMVFGSWGRTALSMADTLELKNGRRIEFDSFREEGGEIRIYVPSGSFVISKHEIRTFRAGGELGGPEMSGNPEVLEDPLAVPLNGSSSTTEDMGQEDLQRREEEIRLREELLENARNIRTTMKDYWRASRREKEPCSESCQQEIAARVAELRARQLDALYQPEKARGEPEVYLRPSPFVGLPPEKIQSRPKVPSPRVQGPPPAYTQQEEQFSKLRARLEELYTQREHLFREMRRKGFETGEP